MDKGYQRVQEIYGQIIKDLKSIIDEHGKYRYKEKDKEDKTDKEDKKEKDMNKRVTIQAGVKYDKVEANSSAITDQKSTTAQSKKEIQK
jgi:hypothetical protein